MEETLELLHAKDTKERMAGVERLQALLEQSRRSLTATEVGSLVDAALGLLKDNNFRVCQGTLQALASASALSSEHLKLHFNVLLPAIVERLGDGKQPVRDAARRLLLALMEISSPTIIVERAGSYAWSHKSWRVREEFARTVASAINLFAATELPFQRALLPSVLQLMEDPNSNAREAAMVCLEEMYRQGGPQLRDELQQHSLRPSQMKEILARFEKIEPKSSSLEEISNQLGPAELKPPPNHTIGGNRRSSPKAKPSVQDTHGGDAAEKPVDPIRMYSEKELTKELDKISGMLAPEQDWSVRMAAMQRIEGLVNGGAAEYACFPSLLKQLVLPLSQQLADRRSSIVKQACHLINLLSKELLADFEHCAEAFIPVLFKLVVITVLVIAESADTCIKTMLRNCRVARVLPRIVEAAKNDRNSVLRARCCDYAQLVLEQWSESPEIHRSVELYEDLIKCCVGDAMSEVRSTARACYRLFSKSWPDRARRLFAGFDPVIQRLINEEDGGIHKRYASPSMRDRGTVQRQQTNVVTSASQSASAGSQLLSFATTPIVAMDRTGSLLSQKAPNERTLESVLQASQQQVNAIETMLKGLDVMDKGDQQPVRINGGGSYRQIHSSGVPGRVGVDPPSARDPPFPASTPALSQSSVRNPLNLGSNSYGRGSSVASIQGSSSSDLPKTTFSAANNRDVTSAILPIYNVKRVPISSDRSSQGSSNDEATDTKIPKRYPKLEMQPERHMMDIGSRDMYFKDSIPGFQRPLLKNIQPTRATGPSRSNIDDTQLSFGESYNYMDGLVSLNDALTDGLSANADWSARVSAFNYLKKLLQQGPRGVQDIAQSFEKVMKLFSQHLDDPHHKVAQSALSALSELVPICRKPFEAYLERILPHIFSRLVDPKEMIRQLGTTVLEIIGNQYSVDSLLPALLRSFDEQRSPKAKMAVIEFAIAAFTKLAITGEAAAGNNLLKMWLAKLAPLANDKNAKLKETAVNGIISVYTHFESSIVLNFILGLTIEEQSSLRRSLKHYTPRIEVELMNYMQNRQKSRSKSMHDQFDLSAAVDDGYGTFLGRANTSTLKSQSLGNFASSMNSDGSRKWSSGGQLESAQFSNRLPGAATAEEVHTMYYQSYDAPGAAHESMPPNRSKNTMNRTTTRPSLEAKREYESPASPQLAPQLYHNTDRAGTSPAMDKTLINRDLDGEQQKPTQSKSSKKSFTEDVTAGVPSLLNQLSSGNDEKSVERKRAALQEFIRLSKANQVSIWSQYLNQILNELLETLDDSDSSIRELALSTVLEMLGHQKDMLEDSVELLLEKLLHSIHDLVAKVATAADRCLSLVLSQYDPYRCLSVVVPLLNSEDEKTLVTCIGCLTKLVGRLPSEDLMAQLPSFLPALFDAFGNQSADVRKTVVFCLVDIYIVLGKAFLPYLGSLSSTQLRLVTIYANRISQARSGAPLDSGPA